MSHAPPERMTLGQMIATAAIAGFVFGLILNIPIIVHIRMCH